MVSMKEWMNGFRRLAIEVAEFLSTVWAIKPLVSSGFEANVSTCPSLFL